MRVYKIVLLSIFLVFVSFGYINAMDQMNLKNSKNIDDRRGSCAYSSNYDFDMIIMSIDFSKFAPSTEGFDE